MISLFNWFVKMTGIVPAFLLFNMKVYYEDPVTKNSIKGPAVIVSNHSSVFDYVILLFLFWRRTVRVQAAEVLFRKKALKPLLKLLGMIYVDRESAGVDFIHESQRILDKSGVVGIFPESRIPLPEEERPLPFKTSCAYIALTSEVPVIPVFIEPHYFKPFKRSKVMVGERIDLTEHYDTLKSVRENLEICSDILRNKVKELGCELSRREGE
ncbi:MAG: 1-acyl-sn-glycerol-3-phosphate acyltransferase [Clostridia bacterium]|nr:1-acyl-sn-glycerol-3-phosphate acyltransferase [Clostridia bacterium]